MRIIDIVEVTKPIASPIRNAYIDFSKMTASLVAVVTDQVRDGRRVVGYGFNSNGRYGQGGLIRERFRDRRPPDKRADAAFMEALWAYFGEETFERGNLDAGRLSWLFGREVVPAEDPFDPKSYDALLRIDVPVARASFPDAFDDEGWE